MKISLRAGRDFSAVDTADSPPVVIINDLFASRHFPDVNPLGRTFSVGKTTYEIIGICETTFYADAKGGKPVTMYLPTNQRIPAAMDFAVRSTLPPASIIASVRQVVAGIDASIPIADVSTQDLQFDRSLFAERLFAGLCGVLGALAIFLSCSGLYGLLDYTVARRTAGSDSAG